MTKTETELKKSGQYSRNYRRRKAQKEEELVEILSNLTQDAKDIVIETIRAANSNPLLGIFIGFVGTDILERLSIIRPTTAAALYIAIGVIEGASVSSDVITSLESVFKFGGKSPSTSLVQPSATTLVYGNKSDDLQTLLKGDKK